jgi:putative drug exporter of the RND superfamily
MFQGASRWIIRWPLVVIGVWAAAVIAVIIVAPKLSDYTTSNAGAGLSNSYQSVQATNIQKQYFPESTHGSGVIVVTQSDNGSLTSGNIQTITGLASALTSKKINGVTSVTTEPQAPFLASNGKAMFINVVFSAPAGNQTVNDAVKTVRNDTNAYLRGTGLVGEMTGSAPISLDTSNAYDSALVIIEIVTVVAIVVLLAIVFRSIIIALLPVVLIALLAMVAEGITAWLAKGFGFQVGNELDPLLVVVMFGVGTDYIVFLLFRYREGLIEAGGVPDDESHREILRSSLAKTMVIVTSAAFTVSAAFIALLAAELESLQTLASGLIVGVLLMMLAALTLVPAIFRLLGKHLFFPYRPRKPTRKTQSERDADFVTGHRVLTLVVSVAIMGGLALGILGWTANYNSLAELPSDTPSLVAYNTLIKSFPAGLLGPTQVLVESSSPSTPLDPTSVSSLVSKLQTTPGISSVQQPQYNAGMNAAQITVILSQDPFSQAAMNNMEHTIEPAVDGAIPGDFSVVGGQTAQLVDVRSAMKLSLKHVIPLALVIIGIILAILLYALVAPIWILVGVALLYAAVLGTVSIVFVTILNYIGIDFTVPLIAYLFVMAVGSDYNILIGSRLREEHNAGRSSQEAARIAVSMGAPAVTSAGLILAATFASLLFTNIELLEEIGVAVIAAVLLASFVLTTKILPVISALLGKYFWFPGRMNQTITGDRPSVSAKGRT